MMRLCAAGVMLALAAPAYAQNTTARQTSSQQTPQDRETLPAFEEQVIVTASRTEE